MSRSRRNNNGSWFFILLLLASGGALVWLFSRNQTTPEITIPAPVTNAPPARQAPPTNKVVTPAPPKRIDTSGLLDLQVALARQAISPGSLDGVLGSQTRSALRAFQKKRGFPVTGE